MNGMKEEVTELFELTSVEEVETFCAQLTQLKRKAPGSLRVRIAITLERGVNLRGKGASTLNRFMQRLSRLLKLSQKQEIKEAPKRQPRPRQRMDRKRRARSFAEYQGG